MTNPLLARYINSAKKFWKNVSKDANKGSWQFQIDCLRFDFTLFMEKVTELENKSELKLLTERDERFLEFLEITKKRVDDKEITDIDFLIDHIRNAFQYSDKKK